MYVPTSVWTAVKSSPMKCLEHSNRWILYFLSWVSTYNTPGKQPLWGRPLLPLILLDFACVRSLYTDENFELIYILSFVFLCVDVCKENYSSEYSGLIHFRWTCTYLIIFMENKKQNNFWEWWEDSESGFMKFAIS